MELLIRQRVFSWTDTYDVYDGQGNPKYFVKADLFSLGHRIRIFSHQTGEELGVISERILTLLPRFEVSIRGRDIGSVRAEFSFFRPRYAVDYMGWQVQGDFLGWDYDVTSGGRTVVSISRELFTWGDTYRLNFDTTADELPGLMLVLAIDAANCSRNKH